MVDFKTLVYGLYPKTENLRKKLSKWERQMISSEEINNIITEEKGQVYDLFSSRHISQFTDPIFNWYDIFRPLVLSIDGFELGPLTRYKETNTFFRLPIVSKVGSLKFDPTKFMEMDGNPPLPLYLASKEEGFTIFLPSPFTFYRMSRVQGNLREEEFVKDLLKVYTEILEMYRARKVLLYESQDPIGVEMSFFNEFVKRYDVSMVFNENLGNVSFNNFEGKFESIIAGKSEADLSKAIEFSKVPGVKLIDARNTKLEDPEKVKGELKSIADQHSLESVVVTHSDYMDFLPRVIADKKVDVLSRIGE